jgi:RHS repeat-associated protein
MMSSPEIARQKNQVTGRRKRKKPETVFRLNLKIVYLYSALGQKLVKQIVVNNTVTQRTDCINGMEVTPSTLSTVVQTGGGRFVKLTGGSWEPQYCYTDHRGDIRVVYRANSTTGTAEVVQEDHLTPFGVQMVGMGRTNWPENQYRYQGKELNTTGFDTNGDNTIDSRLYQYDFGARQYDPLIGRWHSADPMMQYVSPYMAMGNDWVNRVDPTGMEDNMAKYIRAYYQEINQFLLTARRNRAEEIDQIYGRGVYVGNPAFYWWVSLDSYGNMHAAFPEAGGGDGSVINGDVVDNNGNIIATYGFNSKGEAGYWVNGPVLNDGPEVGVGNSWHFAEGSRANDVKPSSYNVGGIISVFIPSSALSDTRISESGFPINEAAYWLNAINTLYGKGLNSQLANLNSRAIAWKAVTSTIPKALRIEISLSKTMIGTTKVLGRGLFLVGMVTSAYETYTSPTIEGKMMASVDLAMGIVSLGMPVVGLIYFTGRLAYDIYNETNP